MRWLPTILGVAAAFLMGAALAVAINPRPLFREIVMQVTGASAYDRCLKAGACNSTQAGPHAVPPDPAPARAGSPAGYGPGLILPPSQLDSARRDLVAQPPLVAPLAGEGSCRM